MTMLVMTSYNYCVLIELIRSFDHVCVSIDVINDASHKIVVPWKICQNIRFVLRY